MSQLGKSKNILGEPIDHLKFKTADLSVEEGMESLALGRGQFMISRGLVDPNPQLFPGMKAKEILVQSFKGVFLDDVFSGIPSAESTGFRSRDPQGTARGWLKRVWERRDVGYFRR